MWRASAHVQGIVLLLRDVTTVILAQTRLGILQRNCVICSIKVAPSCVTTVTPQQLFSFPFNGRTKLPFAIQCGAAICWQRNRYKIVSCLLPLPS